MNVYEYHTAVDEFLGKVFAHPKNLPHCCSRCTSPHCCSEPAYADQNEIKAMIDSLHPAELETVAKATIDWRIKAEPFLGVNLPSAFAYRGANIPCPLLDANGRCRVYEHRPFGCRTFFALGEPQDCAMPARANQKYAEFPEPNLNTRNNASYFRDNAPLELDHIGAHLVRHFLDPKFTTASHELCVLS